MSEYQPTTRPAPEGLEHKSTKDAQIGYAPSPVPNISRYGGDLTEDESHDSTVVPGTFAAGNGVQNSHTLREEGEGKSGLGTDSGGTQTSRRGATSSRSTKPTSEQGDDSKS